MEAQRQRVQMLEHADRDEAQRALLNLGKDVVADFVGGRRQHADEAVAEDERERYCDRRIGARRQRVNHPFVDGRNRDVDDLADDDQRERRDHPQFQPGLALRPQQRHHAAHHPHLLAEAEARPRDRARVEPALQRPEFLGAGLRRFLLCRGRGGGSHALPILDV